MNNRNIGRETLYNRRVIKNYENRNRYQTQISKDINSLTKLHKERKSLLSNIINGQTLLIGALIFSIAQLNKKFTIENYEPPKETELLGRTQKGNLLYTETDEKSIIKNKIIREAEKQGVDPNLALAMAEQESHFNPRAKSGKGAIGVFQLIPETAKGLGVDPHNIDDNIRGGIKYIKQMLTLQKGNINLALASYNAGPGSVAKYKGIPPFKETQDYVRNVNEYYDKYKKERKLDQDLQLASGQSFGGYKKQTGDVQVSTHAAKILSEISGKGTITSGVRAPTSRDLDAFGRIKETSHPSGNKVDIGLGGLNESEIIVTIINFAKHPMVKQIAIEGLEKNHHDTVKKARKIRENIIKNYPEIKDRIKKGELKIETEWGNKYSSGPHLDIMFYPPNKDNYNKVNKNEIIGNDKVSLASPVVYQNVDNDNDTNIDEPVFIASSLPDKQISILEINDSPLDYNKLLKSKKFNNSWG